MLSEAEGGIEAASFCNAFSRVRCRATLPEQRAHSVLGTSLAPPLPAQGSALGAQ